MASFFNVVLIAMVTVTAATKVTVDTSKVIHKTDDHFISFNIDSQFFGDPDRWKHFNYTSERIGMMLAVFSPAILRVGGSSADWTTFNANKAIKKTHMKLPGPVQIMTEQDWYNLNWLVRGTGLRVLYCLNLQQRFGQNWDPTNTAELMDFSTALQMGESVDFELGNEPNVYNGGLVPLDPDQIARDFVSLRALAKQYAWFSMETRIVGPDVVGTDPTSPSGKILKSVAEIAGKDVDAITFHHYYFRGDTAKMSDYLDPAHFDELATEIQNVRNIIKNTSNPDLPYWIGETADAWHSGTPGVSDRFVSGFLWLDKLGLSASMGVGVVMRQTFWGLTCSYGLVDKDLNPNPYYGNESHDKDLSPNPDYWLTLMFFRYVGTKVLSVGTEVSKPKTTRIYAHCTNLRYQFPVPYPEGSVTVYGLNMADNITETIQLTGDLADQPVDQWVLTPGDEDGMLSKKVKINGNLIAIQGDHEMPFNITPVKTTSSKGLVLPPRTFGFFVLPKANIDACKDSL